MGEARGTLEAGGNSAIDELEAVFADGFTRYQLVMAVTQLGRAVAFRDSLDGTRRRLAILSAAVGCAEAVRRRRAVQARDASVGALAQVSPTVASTALSLAATPPISLAGAAPRAVEWAHLPAQWVAAGVSLFERDPIRRAGQLALLIAPFVSPPARTSLAPLKRRRIMAGVTSFVVIAEVLAQRLRGAAEQIDITADATVEESAALAERTEQERIETSVLADAASELEAIRSLIGDDRDAAAERAADEEAILRAWLTDEDRARAHVFPGPDPLPFAHDATERLDLAARRVEMVLRIAGTTPLVLQAALTSTPEIRAVALAATANAVWACDELRHRWPRRSMMARNDIAVVTMAALAEISLRSHDEPSAAEALVGYVASLAPCVGSVNADRELSRSVTVRLGLISLLGAAASGGSLAKRAAIAAERTAMTSGASWFSHWVRDVILSQTVELGEAISTLAATRSDAAASAARRQSRYLVHDSALQVLLWLQKPDLSTSQLVEWIDREVLRLRDPSHVEQRPSTDLAESIDQLIEQFRPFGLHPLVDGPAERVDVPTRVGGAALEVINEGLTNVVKHSGDRAPRLTITTSDTDVLVAIVNVADRSPGPAGTGSAAMRERAAKVGGECVTSWSAGSYELRVRFPRR